MKNRTIFSFILIFAIIFSISLVSASDIDNNVTILEDSNLESDLSLLDELGVDDELSESSENVLSENDSYVIWVKADGGEDGNGSESNPFSSFEKARDDVASGKDNVIINVGEGTYNLNSRLLFNTNNLYINAISNNVIIKNNPSGFFELSNSGGNFSASNIIIDGYYTSGSTVPTELNYIFKGLDANLVTFNNCTFKECWGFLYFDYNGNPFDSAEPYIFNNCKLIYNNFSGIDPLVGLLFRDVKFKNCIIDFTNKDYDLSAGENPKEYGHSTVFEDCWFGVNSLPSCFYSAGTYLGYDVNRYAIFSISENYLGNNLYEIFGKLIWNDSTIDGIENLNPMTVSLSSNTGNLTQTIATLENGTFKVLYVASNSTNHKISATLDSQPASIEFQSINLSLDSPIINYGAKQNITVILPSEYNGVIYVTVNGKTYNKTVEAPNLSTTINITDVLPVGTHPVNVTFNDNKQNDPTQAIYGFNTTTITVLGIPYELNATVPETLYIGDNATVTLKLPEGATGNVTVKVGDNEAKTFNIADTISIGGFIAGDNIVNITYDGNEKYESQSIEKHVFASLKPTALTADNVTTIYGVAKDLVVTLTSNGNVLANKNITIIVGTINKTLPTDDNGQVSVDISTLSPSTYTATISFEGDELYNKSSITAKVSIKEEAKTENITLPEITAGKATTTTIKLPENATGNITVSIDGSVSSVVNLTNGSATITIPALTAGKHNITIAYSGDDKYAAFSQTSTVEVKEPAKPTPKPEPAKPTPVKKQATKIIAKNKKFKAKTKVKKYTITLKTKAGKAIKKVQVTIKIGKKTYKVKTNAKGKATFKIKKLTKKGKYKATIKFKGNKFYKACSKKVKITIKK